MPDAIIDSMKRAISISALRVNGGQTYADLINSREGMTIVNLSPDSHLKVNTLLEGLFQSGVNFASRVETTNVLRKLRETDRQKYEAVKLRVFDVLRYLEFRNSH
ncbi:MAG: hypothetical protein Q9M91_05030 [Candidatus Dojkabacteria bacterium]|nr:hypothetical protein [Candidatus Dojkabacteria bacterium]